MAPCSRCGQMPRPGQRFCEQCGTPVAVEEPIAPPPGSFAAPATPATPPAPSTGSGRRGNAKVIVSVAVVLVLAVLVVGFVLLRRDGGGPDAIIRSPDGQYRSLGQGPSEQPEEQWSERIGCKAVCALGAGNGTVYVASSSSSAVDLEAFEVESGESQWKQRLAASGGVFAVLPVEGRVMLVAGEGVVAVDPADGKRVWESKLRWTGYVGDGVVYLSDLLESATTVAVSIDDGKEQWSEDGRIEGVCDGVAYLNDDERIAALDATSGDQRWIRSLGSAGLACGDEGVFVGDGDHLHRLDRADGTDLWSKAVDEGPSLVADGMVLVDDDEGCNALDVDDGSRKWRSDDFTCSVFPVGDERALGGEVEGDTLLVDLGDGEVLDRSRSQAEDDESFVSAQGRNLYVEFGDDQLHAVRFDDDKLSEAWSIDADRRTRSIELSDDRVFTLTDRELTAYR